MKTLQVTKWGEITIPASIWLYSIVSLSDVCCGYQPYNNKVKETALAFLRWPSSRMYDF